MVHIRKSEVKFSLCHHCPKRTKPIHTPLKQKFKFTTREFDEKFSPETNDQTLEDAAKYMQIIGKLLYLTLSRPDIMFAVQSLSQFMQEPKVSHLMATKKIIQYLKEKPGLGLFFPAKQDMT